MGKKARLRAIRKGHQQVEQAIRREGLPSGMRLATRQAVAEILTEGRTPQKIHEALGNTYGFCNARLDDYQDATVDGKRMACREGCAWCCYLHVTVSPAEALTLTDYLRDTRDPEEFAALVARVEALDQTTHGMDPPARLAARRTCALLVDRRCSVYPYRPLACRGWNSVDAESCRSAVEHADDLHKTELILQPLEASWAIRGGMDTAMQGRRLDTRPVELTAALRVALTTPDATAQWLRGVDLFADCRAGVVETVEDLTSAPPQAGARVIP